MKTRHTTLALIGTAGFIASGALYLSGMMRGALDYELAVAASLAALAYGWRGMTRPPTSATGAPHA
jgi:hypothetical protein